MRNKIALVHLFYFIFASLLLLPFKDIGNSLGVWQIFLAIPSVTVKNSGFMAVAFFIGFCYSLFLSKNFEKKDAGFLVLAELATFLATILLYSIIFLAKGLPFDKTMTRIMVMFIYGFLTLSFLSYFFYALKVVKCKVFKKKP